MVNDVKKPTLKISKLLRDLILASMVFFVLLFILYTFNFNKILANLFMEYNDTHVDEFIFILFIVLLFCINLFFFCRWSEYRNKFSTHNLNKCLSEPRKDDLNVLFEYAPDGYYLNDLKGNFIDGNRIAQQLVGYDKEELIGRSFLKLKLLSPKQLLKAAYLLAKNRLGKATGPDEFILNRKDGTKVPVEIRTYPIRLKNRILVLGIAHDISKRKEIEEKLRKSKDYINNIIRSMIDVLFVITPDKKIKTVNKAACSLLGYKRSEIIGKSIEKYLTPQDPSRNVQIEDMFRHNLVKCCNMLAHTRKGEMVPLNVSCSIMKGQKKNMSRIICIGRDMRKTNELFRELEKKSLELKKSNKELVGATIQLIQSEKMSAIGELTAGVAHELNQPLNVIKIISQSILRDINKNRFKTDELGKYLDDVVCQVNKMAEIIDHMRIFSHPTENKYNEHVDLNSIIDNVLKFIKQQLKQHNIQLVCELEPKLPRIRGNAIRLEQVFLNFINNSRYALDKSHKIKKFIKIKSFKGTQKKCIIVEFIDNGIGIPPKIRPKIFQPFFTSKEPGKGTGLGLAVAKKIIQEHKGKIEVESEEGKVTIFRVIFYIVGFAHNANNKKIKVTV